MPSQSSIYWKIQVVLEVAKSAKVESIVELQNIIKGRNPSNFHTRRFDRAKDSFVTAISDKSIHNTVRFCQDLQLLNADGALTKEGRQAIQKAKFDSVIASCVLFLFEQSEINVSELNKAIVKNIQARPPALPTSKELWTTIDEKIDYSRFSKMLTLLSQCGGAESSQKKVYLHINEG